MTQTLKNFHSARALDQQALYTYISPRANISRVYIAQAAESVSGLI